MPATSPPTLFPLYLLPSLPFRRRRRESSLSTSPTSPTTSPSTSPPTPSYLSRTPTAYLQCHKCLTDLIPITSIISKGFTGRHGRAYLVSPPPALSPTLRSLPPGDLPNTHTHKPVPRQRVTGAHTVADISCKQCGSVLGWKYVEAEEESQRYKVGKFILETKRVVRAAEWEAESKEWEEGGDVEERVEFDSQDEDECEDLFAGVWSQGLARRRRERGFGRG